jgi:hypothetical protein
MPLPRVVVAEGNHARLPLDIAFGYLKIFHIVPAAACTEQPQPSA